MKAVSAFLFFCAFLLVSCSESGTDSKLEFPEPNSSDNSGDNPGNRSAELKGVLLDGTFFEEGLSRNLVFSAKIELVELDENLAQAGHVADGTIDMLGNYTVSTEGLENRYAELSVFGQATPLCSVAPNEFKYSLIVDLASDSVVNISYLAHLASARAKWLMKNEQMDFNDAWKKAEKETHESFALSKEFSPIRSGALTGKKFALEGLSVSVLAELAASRMGLIPNDMRGRITEEFARYGSRAVKDTVGNLMFLSYIAFRKTRITNEFYECDLFRMRMGMVDDSRNQERLQVYDHIDTLWQKLLGESDCDASLEGAVHSFVDSSNLMLALQNFAFFTGEEYYICHENRWSFLKNIEYIQYIYPDYDNGGIKKIKNEMFVFEEETGWRYADSLEYKFNSSCIKATEGKEYEDLYICHDGHWQKMNYDSVYAVTCNEKGEPIQKGKKIEGYVCDSGKAFLISSMDVLLDKYCTDFNAGEVLEVGYSRAVCNEDWTWSKTPLDTIVDSRDGTKYAVIGVGNQRWLGTNLKYIDTTSNANLRGNAWCNYSCGSYGAYYTWSAAMNIPDTTTYDSLVLKLPYQGICPEGWHIPSAAEWDTLQAFARKYDLKSSNPMESLTGSEYSWTIFIEPKNTFGLNIMPAGYRTKEGAFKKEYSYAYYWYAVENPDKFYFYYIWDTKPEFQKGMYGSPNYALTIRCIADEEE